MSQAGEINSGNSIIPGDVPIFFVTNSGTSEAAMNILNVLGASGITTIGGGNTITITPSTVAPPNAVLNEFDDFIGSQNLGGGKLGWQTIGFTTTFNENGTSTNPGIVSVKASTHSMGIYLGQNDSSAAVNDNPLALGGGTLTANWIIQLSTLSSGGNTYVYSCGLADSTTLTAVSDAFVNGVYFQYTDSVNGGNWTLNCTKSSTTTTVNTATAASTSFVNLGISVNAAGTSVTFTINGTSVGTIATNIPTAAITPFFAAINTAGTTPQLNADLWYMSYTLTTPR